jgi:hypothetical protein
MGSEPLLRFKSVISPMAPVKMRRTTYLSKFATAALTNPLKSG